MEKAWVPVIAGVVLAMTLLAGAATAGPSLQFSKNGDTVTITGFTNLAPGDRLLINVVSGAFTPTEKGNGTGFSGAAGSVVVQPGSPLNTYSYDVDVSTFSPGVYLVSVESVETSFRDQGQFTLPWTPVPTEIPPPATTVTHPATTTPFSVQTPTQAPVTTPIPIPLSLAVPVFAAGAAVLLLRRG